MTRSQVAANLVALIGVTASMSYIAAALQYHGNFGPDQISTALGATLGIMVWLVAILSILPVAWWGLRSFRSEAAAGPLVLWWILFVMTLVPMIVGAARAQSTELAQAQQPLCMSDQELQSFLSQVMIDGFSAGAKHCCTRYGTANIDCSQETKFRAALGGHVQETHDIAVVPFRRAYGSQGEARFLENLRMAVASGDEQRASFTEEQCAKYMNGLEAMTTLGPESISIVVKQFFSFERARTPPCP